MGYLVIDSADPQRLAPFWCALPEVRVDTTTITEFAGSYADQNDKDHRALVDAVAEGNVAAQSGV